MPRPPIPIGTYGSIRIYQSGKGFRAVTDFRDFDGITRRVEKSGPTRNAAELKLKEVLRDRAKLNAGDGIKSTTRLSEVADRWMQTIDAAVAAGRRSPSTAVLYRGTLRRYVLPATGALQVREATVPRLDVVLQAIVDKHGVANAKAVRAVLSGMLGLAVRHGALSSNPVRDLGRIEGQQGRAARALTGQERRDWLAQLDADGVAVRRDLPELCRFMLGTGVRIGEALAVLWDDIDFERATVTIEHTIVRIPGVGLLRKSTKSRAGERTLPLPPFVLTMLMQREAQSRSVVVFPDARGGWRDPSNTSRALREARGSKGFGWVTSHVFRKTCATILDEAGLTARVIADQLGHSRISMTQDNYLGRDAVNEIAAQIIEAGLNGKGADHADDDQAGPAENRR